MRAPRLPAVLGVSVVVALAATSTVAIAAVSGGLHDSGDPGSTTACAASRFREPSSTSA